jgi:hypothetical protein
MAPRLLVAFGTDRQRFANAEEIQRYSGIAPLTVASGQSKWVHVRWACPKFLRQTFHEFAGHSLIKCQWARAFYDLHIHNGSSHHAARARGPAPPKSSRREKKSRSSNSFRFLILVVVHLFVRT